MVGAWNLKGRESGLDGEIRGRLTFEWMEGGFFLVQHVDINYIGRKIRGVEYIGYDAARGQLRSHVFSNAGPGPFNGMAIEYVWEISDDGLTIWGGAVGSPARFRGRFNRDHDVLWGRWEWPDGGYEATLARVAG
jgi:hypothetical protein